MSIDGNRRVLSGMRPTGRLHLGHYHGVLKNWVELQHEYQCFFFVADWHALTTGYENTSGIADSAFDIVVDWLSVGVNPGEATIFVQSRVPEHAELHLLLSMITPLSWLERVPTYKDQQDKLKENDLSTYGFLGYPLLQAADILGTDMDDIRTEFRERQLINLYNRLDNDIYTPFFPSENIQREFRQIEERIGVDNPFEEVRDVLIEIQDELRDLSFDDEFNINIEEYLPSDDLSQAPLPPTPAQP